MVISALEQRVRTLGPQPLLVHYDGGFASRVELSGITFANWVDKTANLLESLGVDAGETVRIELVDSAPGHWVTLVWVAACWQRGCVVTTSSDDAVAAVVAGPGAVAARVPTVVCSLHPLGRGLDTVPSGCTDYAEVLSEPDAHWVEPTTHDDLALLPDTTFGGLSSTSPRSTRALFVDPSPGWSSVLDILVSPLLGGGSSVVATRVTAETAARIRRDERVDT